MLKSQSRFSAAARLAWWLAGLAPSLVVVAQAVGQEGLYQSMANCGQCHEKTAADVERNRILKASAAFVRFNEAKVWTDLDLHSQAYQALLSDRSRRMGQLLKLDTATDRACVGCHTVVAEPQRIKRLPGLDQAELMKEGVGCEACHGPSSRWDEPHRELTWRNKPSDEKKSLGMIDVRDPIERTRLCLACHLGNREQGKLLTHEMYAAGHPPLPGFEIESLADNMPRHWRYVHEKQELTPQERTELGDRPGAALRTERVVIGGAVVLAESMKLLAALAEGEQANSASAWPPLAEFECGACHHDLKLGGWRHQRTVSAGAGRPMPRAWDGPLTEISLLHSTPEDRDSLTAGLEALGKALGEEPFGNPVAVGPAAQSVANRADALAIRLKDDFAHGRLSAAAVLARLSSFGGEKLLDYDSARQLAWALRIVQSEAPTARHSDQVLSRLKALTDAMQLDREPGASKALVGQLPEALQLRARFDPLQFQAELRAPAVGDGQQVNGAQGIQVIARQASAGLPSSGREA